MAGAAYVGASDLTGPAAIVDAPDAAYVAAGAAIVVVTGVAAWVVVAGAA